MQFIQSFKINILRFKLANHSTKWRLNKIKVFEEFDIT